MKKITLKQNGTFEHVWIKGVHLIPKSAIEVSDADFMLLSQNTASKRYDITTSMVLDYIAPPPTQAQLDVISNQVEFNLLAKIDAESIRDIREWIASQPDASQGLKDREASAVAARARIK